MKRLAAGLLALALAVPISATAREDGIEAVIVDQIEAFRSDDFASAFAHASPGIQSLFGSPDRFGRMVEQGYPMVHRPSDVDFLSRRAMGNGQKQRVMMRDAGGSVHVLEYDMIEIDGEWRIDGVHLIEAGQVGA